MYWDMCVIYPLKCLAFFAPPAPPIFSTVGAETAQFCLFRTRTGRRGHATSKVRRLQSFRLFWRWDETKSCTKWILFGDVLWANWNGLSHLSNEFISSKVTKWDKGNSFSTDSITQPWTFLMEKNNPCCSVLVYFPVQVSPSVCPVW